MAEAGHQRPNGEAAPRRHHAPTPQAAPSGPTLAGPPSIASGSPAGGQPLAQPVRQTLEGSFNVDLGQVRVYTDSAANQAATNLSARAFTYGPQIFLGSGERPSDLGLMAHEVAHVVQQGQAPVVQRSAIQRSSKHDVAEREAEQAAACVTTGATVHVEHRVDRPQVQRLGLSDVLDYFAEKAYLIPGYRMFTIVLGFNPINMQRAERSAANILRAFIEFLPGGNLITQALDAYGILEKVGAWVEQQLSTLGDIGAAVRRAISQFLDSLGFSDIFHLGDVWDRAKRIFTDPIDRIISFAKGLVTGIIGFIKDAILQPLAKLAEGTRGYDLLKAVLGRDPITGEPVPRNADTLIGGFMKLIGQEEVWTNIKRANAIPRAWAWFQGALEGLLGFVRQIPSLFISALRQLELFDIVVLPRAFIKLGRVFGGFIGDFLGWAGRQVLSLLQIIFEVIAPSVMPYLRKAAGAFRMIIQNPVGFIGNLVRAGIQGFKQFATNFLNHLKKSLIDWLTGTLVGAGVYIPQALELREIIKFVLSVLGLTWQNLRGKLAKAIGEPAVKALETGFDLVVTLVRDGPAAAWDKIRESLSNLREMVMDGIMAFVRDRIVQAAITRLITSLNPAGAFIQAIIAIYNTVMFFIERLRQIAQVVASFIDSIAAIASGNIGTAANRVETTMGGLLTLVISFLARLVGLGKVSDAIKNILDRVRAPIDRALDRVANWIGTTARNFLARGRGAAGPDARTDADKQRDLAAAAAEADRLLKDPNVSPEQLASLLPAIQQRYRLTRLTIAKDSETDAEETDHVVAEINPKVATPPIKKPKVKTGNTAVTAIPMTWYKPPNIYKAFYLKGKQYNPMTATYIDVPALLQPKFGATKRLIGISVNSIKNVGDVLQRTKSPPRGVERDFKELLEAHGFPWPNIAPDHVHDLGWGGPDAFTNLWPLDSATNGAVNKVYNQDVTYSDKGTPTKGRPIRLIGKFFKITKRENP